MRKRKIGVIVVMAALVCGLLLASCSKKEPEKPEEPKAPEVTAEAVVELKNDTEYDITGIALRPNTTGETISDVFGDELLEENQTVPSGGVFRLEYAEEYDKDAAFDIKMAYGEGKAILLTSVPVGDMRSVTVKQEGELFYVEYESIETGETVSTKEHEQKLLDEYNARKKETEEIENSRNSAEDEEEARKETEDLMKARNQNNSGSVD